MPKWLPYYGSHFGQLTPEVYEALCCISASSIDRVLKPFRVHDKPHGLSGTKPGTLLKTQIPIKTNHWDVTKPGFLEADTVAHCGTSMAGNFIWSLTMTDILTGWTECRAVWNKGGVGVCAQIRAIEACLPFPILGFDCDNGSEFLNHHLWRYFADRPENALIQFTRSRPYHKNDNAHVEQKNWTQVRQCFDYYRLDDRSMLEPMNHFYQSVWSLYQNHFCPVLKCIRKIKVGSKYRRVFDEPQTPYERLLKSACINPATKEILIDRHNALDPFVLKHQIDTQLKAFFRRVKVT